MRFAPACFALAALAACRGDEAAPVLTLEEDPPAEVRAGVPLALALRATDRDSAEDALVVTATGTIRANGSVRPDGTVALTLVPPPGPHVVRIAVHDPKGHHDALEVAFVAVEEDADGDGAAHPVWDGTDCDDDDPSRHPAAPEVCDGVDQDCDAMVDEDATDAVTAWPDADGDGYGDDVAGPAPVCDPTGYALRGGDCDDADRRVREGQTVVGRAGCSPFGPAIEWVGETPGDRAGDNVVDAGDLDGDGLANVAVAAVDAEGGAGAVYVVAAAIAGSTSLATAPGKLLGAAPGHHAGYDLAGLPDRDADGRGELLVGAPGAGEVYLVHGLASGVLPEVAALVLTGDPVDAFGTVGVGGDLDGDGVADLLVGAVLADMAAGYVAVVPGTLTGTHAVGDVALATFAGEPEVEAGDPVSAGDLDGDGLGDVVIGAQGDSSGGPDAGAVYVVRSPIPSGTVDLAGADAKWLGPADSITGHSADGLGDVDGDGRDDLAIGAPYDGPNGAKSGSVWVVFGPGPDGETPLPSIADATFEGDRAGIRAGFSVSRGHDLDQDGARDLVIGAKFDDSAGTEAGSVFLVTGPFAGTSSLADAAFKLLGQAPGDLFGDVGASPDVDGDGRPDVLVGARHHAQGGPDAGAAYVVFGADF